MANDMKKLKIVDAHHHFWNLSEYYYPWLQNSEEKHFAVYGKTNNYESQ